jgi:selenocysteine lyase/cysteine desulfurase
MGQVGIRYGHFYAYTMVDQLSPKIDIDEGVVRISLVHYNTVKEVEKIIEILKEVFAQDDLSLAPKERTTSGY